MQNLTGGISVFNLWKRRTPEKLEKAYEKLLLEYKLGVLLCAKTGGRHRVFENSKGWIVTIHEMGLLPNHAYTVTSVRKVETTGGTKCLIRIRYFGEYELRIYFVEIHGDTSSGTVTGNRTFIR